jgi:hypothetical protein
MIVDNLARLCCLPGVSDGGQESADNRNWLNTWIARLLFGLPVEFGVCLSPNADEKGGKR